MLSEKFWTSKKNPFFHDFKCFLTTKKKEEDVIFISKFYMTHFVDCELTEEMYETIDFVEEIETLSNNVLPPKVLWD